MITCAATMSLLSVAAAHAGPTLYCYDSLGQLVASSRGGDTLSVYSYDQAGNRVASCISNRAAPGGGSTSPHRYWRLKFYGNEAQTSSVAMAEVEAFNRIGDDNLLHHSDLTSSAVLNGQDAIGAADGRLGIYSSEFDLHAGNVALQDQNGYVAFDFVDTPRVLNHVAISGVELPYNGADPAAFDVQYSDVGGPDDSAWATAWSVLNQPLWGNFERRIFDRPAREDAPYTGSPHGAHRFWRVLMLDAAQPYYGFGLSELELRGVPGGATLTGAGAALESSHYDVLSAQNLFDGDAATSWGSSGFGREAPALADDFVGYDFGSAVSVSEVLLRSRLGAGRQAPSNWMLQFSDDGVTWNIAAQFRDDAPWADGEARTYTDPLYRGS